MNRYGPYDGPGFVDPKDILCNTKMLAPEALRGCGGILVSLRAEFLLTLMTDAEQFYRGLTFKLCGLLLIICS